MQSSHYAIGGHTFVILHKINSVSKNWCNLFIELSLRKTLEEVASLITEYLWFNDNDSVNICFYYVHCIILFCLLKKVGLDYQIIEPFVL